TIEQETAILNGLKEKYETYHGVSYTDEAIKACVVLSSRYIQDRHLPDKAIDLLDEAGSKANLQIDAVSGEQASKRLKEIEAEKAAALQEENYELAAKLRDEEEALHSKTENRTEEKQATVKAEDIQAIIEQKTGIPVGKLQHDDQKKMKELEANLSSRVIGQAEAVKKVAKAVKRSRAGLKSKNRPVG
ncbi:ATP-dependent Clp protease ATP-binding subunit, partial [Bacillus swezeyi]